MPFPLSTLAIAALAVGGVATGVGTAAASGTPATPPSVVAARTQEHQLATDITQLQTTAHHLESRLATVRPHADSGTTVAPTTTTVPGVTVGAGTGSGAEPTTTGLADPAHHGGDTVPGPTTGDDGAGSTTEPTTVPSTVPTEPSTTPTTVAPTTTTTTQPRHDGGGDGGDGGDGGGDGGGSDD